MTRACAVAARKSSCGVSVITFSGQVAWHSPHCTQASSAKRSIGRSGSSEQRAGRTGRHAGEAQRAAFDIDLDGAERRALAAARSRRPAAGAARCSSRNASRMHVALAADRPRSSPAAARPAPARWRAAPRRSASGSSVSMVATLPAAKPRPVRIGAASASVRTSPVTSWRGLARTRSRTAIAPYANAAAIALEADLRHLVDGERQHVGRQAVAEARQRIDQSACRARRRAAAPPARVPPASR